MSAGGEDRLSALPDEILHHILSFIPSTELHAQTSVLAKRWRHLWAHHPNLHFSMSYPKNFKEPEETESIAKSYVSSVDRCLLSVDPPSLDRVSIDLWLPRSCSPAESKALSKTADRWLRFVGLRSARKLSVQVRAEPGRWYGRIPLSLFCCRSLTDLNASFSAFPNVPAKFQGFRNLTKLVIGCGIISNEAVADLLDGCPLLEDLKLIGLDGLSFVEISPRSSPRLKHLLILGDYQYSKWMRASIDAPNLMTICLVGSLPELEWKGSAVLNQAELTSMAEEDFKSFDDWMKVVNSVSSARVLKVNYWFYQFEIRKNYVNGPLFKNLKELHCGIDWITGSVLRSLMYCLGECPLLEKLMINLNGHVRSPVKDSVEKASNEATEVTPDGYIFPPFRHTDALLKLVEDEHEKDGWNPFEHLDELDYFLHHLKIITVKEFLGSKNEMQLLGFLLGKATALQQFVVFDLLLREEWELCKVFATVRRASSQVQMRLSQWDNLKYRYSEFD